MPNKKEITSAMILLGLVSVFLFFTFKDMSVVDEIVIKSVKIVEGESFGDYREGEAVATLVNGFNKTLQCTVFARLYREDELVSTYSQEAEVAPGREDISVPIELPNGENQVTVNAECV